jgi:hypothetical protein
MCKRPVFTPILADAAAASHPACPPPITGHIEDHFIAHKVNVLTKCGFTSLKKIYFPIQKS